MGVYSLYHELGHAFDYYTAKKLGLKGWISDQLFWIEAITEDEKNSKEKSPTEYGKSASREDFAESVMLYYLNYDEFLLKFPNRSKIINGLIKQLDTLKAKGNISLDDFGSVAKTLKSMDTTDSVSNGNMEAQKTSETAKGEVIEF